MFGRRERIGLEAERRERGERLPQARIAGGDDTDRQPGRLRELRESGLERVPHARTDRQRLDTSPAWGTEPDDLRELEQGERVARAGAHQVVGGAARQPAAMREQCARVDVVEPGDHVLDAGSGAEHDRLLAARRREHGDPLGREAAGRERERLDRRLVDPLRVVDR